MLETVIISLVVAGAAIYIGRSLYRSIAGKKSASCDCKTDCALSEHCGSEQTCPPAGRDNRS